MGNRTLSPANETVRRHLRAT